MKGATLIELMLALFLSIFIFSGLSTIYLAVQATCRMQAALTIIQENGRIARSLLSRDIKMAGYAGCARLRSDYPLSSSIDFTLTNENKIQAYHSTAMKAGSAGFTVRHAAKEYALLIEPMNNYSLLYASAKPVFSPNDIVHVSNCSKAELFKVKEVIKVNNGTQKIITEKPLHNLYEKNSEISQFNINTYFIAQTTRRKANGSVIYALYKQDNKLRALELVEGIEEMKVKYSFFANGHLNESAEEKINDWSKIVGVSIMLTLTSFNFALLQKNEYIYVSLRFP